MCGRRAVLPNVMKVLVQYDRTSAALYRGGCGDIWKGDYCGHDVAVKVIRTYSNSDLQKILGVSCWMCSASMFTDEQCTEVLQGSCDLENPPASERSAPDWSNNGREPVCNGVRLDGEWKHQRLREGTPGCKPAGASTFFVVSTFGLFTIAWVI